MSWDVPNRAELGRDAWGVLHAAADRFVSAVSFRALALNLVESYACDACRNECRAACRELLTVRLGLVKTRTAAVAWAARLHACVTRSLLRRGEGYVSSNSAELARIVEAEPDDERLMAELERRMRIPQ
jgi:hypothetical protein